MNAEVLWLHWSAQGWDVPLPVCAMYVGWLSSDYCYECWIDEHGNVLTDGRGVRIYHCDEPPRDYTVPLLALWVERNSKESPTWWKRFDYLIAVFTDEACLRWAREFRP